MASRSLREGVAPAYLLLCLLLGGSAQGIWVNAILQLLAVGIIAWAALAPDQGNTSIWGRRLMVVCAIGLLVILIQLIPMPPAIWGTLPGRQIVTDGYAILGLPLPWMAVTLAPDQTLSTVLRLLPPAAILAAMVGLKAYRPAWMAWALIAGTCAGVFLGALQVTGGGNLTSPWYPYPISNFGSAVGFFANSNHMAMLLVVTIPFLFALVATTRREREKKSIQKRSALFALAGALLLVVLLGLALNRSLAGFGLGLPALAASVILLLRPERQGRWLLAPVLVGLIAVGTIFMLPVTASVQSLGAGASFETRRAVGATSLRAAGDFLPLGSGLGSFPLVYPLYEDPDRVDRTFVNHAHNDYLEMAIEAGLPGMLWVLLFLVWWFATARVRWRDIIDDPFARAGTIASAAILAHSLVDFPLRTSAMAAVLAASVALMAQSFRPNREKTESDIRPARHLEIR
ncbi:MAG TPA: O-antigen ligase family protein [Sphingomicrobium sp.]|nr:O-antigen ligase family protein [Sphingomicrobium sp.]